MNQTARAAPPVATARPAPLGRLLSTLFFGNAALFALDAPGVRTVDATGLFAVPGCNDMHVHAFGPDASDGTLAPSTPAGPPGPDSTPSSTSAPATPSGSPPPPKKRRCDCRRSRCPPFVERRVQAAVRRRLINPAAYSKADDVARLQRVFDTHSHSKAPAIAEEFAVHGTWHVPTLMRLRTQQLADLPEFASDPRLRYLPPLKTLQMTTSDAAVFLGRTAETGRLAPGYLADLVVLEGDPP